MPDSDQSDTLVGNDGAQTEVVNNDVLQPVIEAPAISPVLAGQSPTGEMLVIADTVATKNPIKESEPHEDTGNGINYGDWTYEPWKGMAHWVNAVTGETTFNETRLKREFKQ